MSKEIVKVPDIGDYDNVDVIEVLVKVGDQINEEDPIVSLETDKATMEVPAPKAGKVVAVHVKEGGTVSEGDVLIDLETAASSESSASSDASQSSESSESSDASQSSVSSESSGNSQASSQAKQEKQAPSSSGSSSSGSSEQIIEVPDIGDYDSVDVIEILVKVGDEVNAEDPLISLETDKATMEVPSPAAGKVIDIMVKEGGKVSKGDAILKLASEGGAGAGGSEQGSQGGSASSGSASSGSEQGSQGDSASSGSEQSSQSGSASSSSEQGSQGGSASSGSASSGSASSGSASSGSEQGSQGGSASSGSASSSSQSASDSAGKNAVSAEFSHASPSVRRFARELGANISKISGTGPKGRITQEDAQKYIKAKMQSIESGAAGSDSGLGLLPDPKVDFAKFGEIKLEKLSRINKISAANLHRNWVKIPHITLFDDADITEMDAFRKAGKQEALDKGVKLTPLAFIVKAVAKALVDFPRVNSSLSADGENLVIKNYVNMGVAVDTPVGLMVPVIKDADKKGVYQIAKDIIDFATRAREGKLTGKDMQGGTFTISSMGGLGTTAFTPIVNMPEVAILGVSKSSQKPVYKDGAFVPRLMLPLSLSLDHRVIDGALGAKFLSAVCANLSDLKRLIL